MPVLGLAQEHKDVLARQALEVLIEEVDKIKIEIEALKHEKLNTVAEHTKTNIYVVKVSKANVRKCPSLKCSVVKIAKEGEKFNILKIVAHDYALTDKGTYIFSPLLVKL